MPPSSRPGVDDLRDGMALQPLPSGRLGEATAHQERDGSGALSFRLLMPERNTRGQRAAQLLG